MPFYIHEMYQIIQAISMLSKKMDLERKQTFRNNLLTEISMCFGCSHKPISVLQFQIKAVCHLLPHKEHMFCALD